MRGVYSSVLPIILSGATAAAQSALPEVLTLERALEILRERNALLLSERQREAAATGELEQARKLPNPLFSLETESFDTVQGEPAAEEVFLAVQQPIPTAGKRGKRTELAAALVRA
ncbi:MAG: hypothetical protein ACRD21_28805, partial [Vicinamibacteria bacterium]